MSTDRIEELLKQADRTAGRPRFAGVDASLVRRRGYRKRLLRTIAPMTAAAVLVLASVIWGLSIRAQAQRQQQIASLHAQITQLSARTDTALNLIKEVLEKERRQQELEALEAKLADFSDPLEEARMQVDKTAFILIYHGDQMYRRLNDKAAAIEAYRRVIKLFPDNRWAQVAQQRLSEIENKRINKVYPEGDTQCKPQDGQSC